jgi:hypothetical protein
MLYKVNISEHVSSICYEVTHHYFSCTCYARHCPALFYQYGKKYDLRWSVCKKICTLQLLELHNIEIAMKSLHLYLSCTCYARHCPTLFYLYVCLETNDLREWNWCHFALFNCWNYIILRFDLKGVKKLVNLLILFPVLFFSVHGPA